MTFTPRPGTTASRYAVTTEWNKGEKSMSEIGAMFGKSRNVIGRLLWEARCAGVRVLTIDRATSVKRRAAAMRRNRGQPT